MSKIEKLIKDTFYNPEEGYVGIDKLLHKLQQKNKYITRDMVKRVLEKQEVYQTSKKNYGKLGSFIPQYPLQEFQIDLIYLEHRHLNKASYGLVAIDAFTKRAHIELMKRKTAPETVNAMQKILDTLGVPEMIYCDEGSEFNNASFKNLMKENNIELVFTLRHASIAERFNRTIKDMIAKYLQSTETKTITNVLPKLLDNYNNSYHKTIGMTPNEATKEENYDEAMSNILKNTYRKVRETINVGDKVRVQLKKKSFDKGFKPKFSKQIYTVEAIEDPYYSISGLDRKYLRAFIEKVGETEKNIVEPDLEGTMEGFLKELQKREKIPETMPQPEPAIKTREKRAIKKPERFRD